MNTLLYYALRTVYLRCLPMPLRSRASNDYVLCSTERICMQRRKKKRKDIVARCVLPQRARGIPFLITAEELRSVCVSISVALSCGGASRAAQNARNNIELQFKTSIQPTARTEHTGLKRKIQSTVWRLFYRERYQLPAINRLRLFMLYVAVVFLYGIVPLIREYL